MIIYCIDGPLKGETTVVADYLSLVAIPLTADPAYSCAFYGVGVETNCLGERLARYIYSQERDSGSPKAKRARDRVLERCRRRKISRAR